MKKLFIYFVSTILFVIVLTQDYALAQKVKKDSLYNKMKPNNKHFMEFYIGVGAITGPSASQGSTLSDYYSSSNFTFGIRYIRSITNIETIGAYFAYDDDSYSIKQDANKIPLDTINGLGKLKMHNKENLTYHALTLGIYNRFKFNERKGKKYRIYLDVGAYGSWNFRIDHYTMDDMNGNILREYTTHLDYPQRATCGFYAQLGIDKLSIYLKDRISNLFKEEFREPPYNFGEFPRYELGLQFAIFQFWTGKHS